MRNDFIVIDTNQVDQPTVLRNEVLHYINKYDRDPVHSKHVCKLALSLFDQLKHLHLCGEQERLWLECAAYLHDIGYAVSRQKHHKHSMRMILGANLPSMSERDKRIIANVARYHRKGSPKKKHHEFMLLSEEDQYNIQKLASLLRIADALDRSHQANVKEVNCENGTDTLTLHLIGEGSFKEARLAIEKKKNLFVRTFGMYIQLSSNQTQEEQSTDVVFPATSKSYK